MKLKFGRHNYDVTEYVKDPRRPWWKNPKKKFVDEDGVRYGYYEGEILNRDMLLRNMSSLKNSTIAEVACLLYSVGVITIEDSEGRRVVKYENYNYLKRDWERLKQGELVLFWGTFLCD